MQLTKSEISLIKENIFGGSFHKYLWIDINFMHIMKINKVIFYFY